MSFPSNDAGYEKKGRIKGRNDNAEPMQVWHAVVKDKNHDVVLKIFDLDHKNAELLDAIQVFEILKDIDRHIDILFQHMCWCKIVNL
jgi:hypothetical protein